MTGPPFQALPHWLGRLGKVSLAFVKQNADANRFPFAPGLKCHSAAPHPPRGIRAGNLQIRKPATFSHIQFMPIYPVNSLFSAED
jgi:hypothetical protein